MAFSSKISILFAAGALLCAMFSPVDGFAATFQCNMSKAKLINDTGRATTRTTFVTVATMNVVQGGTAGGCIVVQFSAQAGVAAGGFLQIQILLDDIVQTAMSFADSEAASHSVMFPIAGVFPGTHNIKITMRSLTGANVNIERYTLAVFYVP